MYRKSTRIGDSMNLRRLVIPLMAVLAIVALGVVATTTLVVASPQQSPSAQEGSTPVPTPDIVLVFPPTPSVPPTPKPVTQENTEPKPAPKQALDRGPKGSRIPPGPVVELSSPSISGIGDSSGKGDTSGSVYTWQDGDRTQRVVLQNDLVAQSKSEDTSNDVIVAKMGGYSIVEGEFKQGSGAQPVFKPESGGGLMTLPGGMMLVLDSKWDQAAVDKFFAGNDINPDQVSELDFLDNAFFVQTEPGMPSLELANELADKDGVIVSSPNWQQQFEAK